MYELLHNQQSDVSEFFQDDLNFIFVWGRDQMLIEMRIVDSRWHKSQKAGSPALNDLERDQ